MGCLFDRVVCDVACGGTDRLSETGTWWNRVRLGGGGPIPAEEWAKPWPKGRGALFRLLFPSSSPPSIHPAALWWKNGPAAAGKEEHAVIKNDVAPGGTNHGLSRTNILLENNGGAELQKESESSSAAVVGHKCAAGPIRPGWR
ncbi:hypothetical protein niasHT_027761 [Heterodera trifolii]|uniref:Uncharacterized protein n=1 Tax=Heterodera trifolii TaxID=157864 RepID=A0ABD2KIK0_9BILA